MSDYPAPTPPDPDDHRLASLLDPSAQHDDEGDAALSALLLALVAPASPDDLVGRDAATARFALRAAQDPGSRGLPLPLVAVASDRSDARTLPGDRTTSGVGWRPLMRAGGRADRGRVGAVRRLVAAPAVAAVAGGVVLAGGLAAAAFTGSLPDALQEIASRVIGAPPPARGDTVPVVPPALGPTPTTLPGQTPGAVPGATPTPGPSTAVAGPGGTATDGTGTGEPGSTGTGPLPSVPGLPVPSVPGLPAPTVPGVPLPTVSVPVIPLPTVSVPPLPLPSLPGLPLPTVSVPPIPLPTVSVPPLPLPKVTVPALPPLLG